MAAWLIPVIIAVVITAGLYRKVNIYTALTDGAKEGLHTWIAIVPHLVIMMAAVAVFRASGAADWIAGLFKPLTSLIGIPPEVVPLAIIRPISGSATLAMLDQIMREFGADSYIAKLAAVMQGSTDTTLYVLAIYFGAAGIKKTGDALKIGLLADAAAFASAVLTVAWLL
ncbi:spore maturation protein [Domibacillus epiphyticus]|uniref:Spore maturation protein n=1 Tax=Domibacillus epiphyticus TaxID=1714355 RepID=A0A1V2A509_9BACI|nr:nucleoside recognition domain-containing protein [Domibacillus epiphyticus]OMP65894.1 spore maturation protein [Domibacillus epiphyticus]